MRPWAGVWPRSQKNHGWSTERRASLQRKGSPGASQAPPCRAPRHGFYPPVAFRRSSRPLDGAEEEKKSRKPRAQCVAGTIRRE